MPITVDGADRDDLVVSLAPRGSIAGRVVARDARPIADVQIRVACIDAPIPPWRSSWTRSRDDGAFVVVGLDPGRYELSVDGAEPIRVEIAGSERHVGVVIVTANDTSLRVRVVDASGLPVAGARVHATADGPGGVHHAETDACGAVVFADLHEGSYLLMADLDDASSRLAAVVTGSDALMILEASGALTMRVFADGALVAHVDVSCEQPGHRDSEADIEGTHTFRRLPAGEHTYEARADSGVARGTVTITSGEHVHLDVELARWARARGTVVDAFTGEPREGWLVVGRGESIRTGIDGRFEVRVRPGDDEIAILDGSVTRARCRARPGEVVELGRVDAVPRCGRLGLSTEASDGALRVTHVHRGGPAEAAGLTEEAIVVAIDDDPIDRIGPVRAPHVLNHADQTVTLTLADGTRVALAPR